MAASRTSRSADLSADPAQAIVAVIARLDPDIDHDGLAALICKKVPYPRWRLKIADQLEDRPDLLTGAGAHGSAAIVSLIDTLRARGVAGVVAPACPFCERVVRLPRGRDGVRCCMSCWKQAHTKPCARCGTLGSMERRTSDGKSLCAACSRAEPSVQEACGSCGRMALAARRDQDVVFCQNCCTPPVTICSVCGRRKPCTFADTDAPRCKNCGDKQRAEPCAECGQRRVVNRRTEAGEPLCKSCGSADTCSGCQRYLPIRSRTPEGNRCQTCHKHDAAAHRACTRCGTVERLHHFGLCAACAWPDTIRKLLTPLGGTLRPELEPVLAALVATEAATSLNWVARARTQKMFASLATGTVPITHSLLDELTPAGAATRLRAILVDAAILPARDERLISLEHAIERRITRVDNQPDRKILRSFATWYHLRRLRTISDRQPLTPDQVTYASNSLTATANLLNWLRERDRSLATCTQEDIDDWLAIDTFSRSRGFVTWAVERGLARAIEVPPFTNEPVREVFAEHDQRWATARRLLTDNTIAVADRVAGLLVLLYAQRATQITRLTTNHVTVTDNGVQLRLGDQPITVPTAFGDLLNELLDHRRGAAATGPEGSVWLYPAPRLGQALAPRILLHRLRALGIPPTIGRNTALMEMAGEMPAAVITRLLGISLHRATRWTQDAGNTRLSYAAEIAHRDQQRSWVWLLWWELLIMPRVGSGSGGCVGVRG